MRIFEEFPETTKCPICGTNDPGDCVLAGIDGTEMGGNMEANCYHLRCIELIESSNEGYTYLHQIFVRKDKENDTREDKEDQS